MKYENRVKEKADAKHFFLYGDKDNPPEMVKPIDVVRKYPDIGQSLVYYWIKKEGWKEQKKQLLDETKQIVEKKVVKDLVDNQYKKVQALDGVFYKFVDVAMSMLEGAETQVEKERAIKALSGVNGFAQLVSTGKALEEKETSVEEKSSGINIGNLISISGSELRKLTKQSKTIIDVECEEVDED